MPEQNKKSKLEELTEIESFLTHADETLIKDPWNPNLRMQLGEFYENDLRAYAEKGADIIRANIEDGYEKKDENGNIIVKKPGLKGTRKEITDYISQNLNEVIASMPKELLLEQLENLPPKDKEKLNNYRDLFETYFLIKSFEAAEKGDVDAKRNILADFWKESIPRVYMTGANDETVRQLYINTKNKQNLGGYIQKRIEKIDESKLKKYVKEGLSTLDEESKTKTYLELAKKAYIEKKIEETKN